jgi:hypothetical protein
VVNSDFCRLQILAGRYPNELTGYFPSSNNLSQSLSDKFQFVDFA